MVVLEDPLARHKCSTRRMSILADRPRSAANRNTSFARICAYASRTHPFQDAFNARFPGPHAVRHDSASVRQRTVPHRGFFRMRKPFLWMSRGQVF